MLKCKNYHITLDSMFGVPALMIEAVDTFNEETNKLPVLNCEYLRKITGESIKDIDVVCIKGGERDSGDVAILTYDIKMAFPRIDIAWLTNFNIVAQIDRADMFDWVGVEWYDDHTGKLYQWKDCRFKVTRV